MDAPTLRNSLATMPIRKTKVESLNDILWLPDGKRIIVYSWDGSFRVRDLKTGAQVGEEWEDKEIGVETMVLSPDGKKVASGSWDGVMKLWSVDTGEVIKTWTGHTKEVTSLSWGPDGGRVVSGSDDGTFRVWDVDSGKTILGPIKAAEDSYGLGVRAVCYSPDAKMIATGGIMDSDGLKIWDANSGKLLKTFEGVFWCLAWTSDGKTLIAEGSKFDTATWTKVDLCKDYVNSISVSPNDRILATTSYEDDKTSLVQLWDLETNLPIGTPLHHLDSVESATFSVDGKFLLTCDDDHIYTWDVSAIVKEAGLPSDILDVTPRPQVERIGILVNPETNIMDAPTVNNSLTTMPIRKIKVNNLRVKDILCLPDGKRIIVNSYDGSIRVRDLETGTQVGEEWEDKEIGVKTMVLSPDGKKIAGGSSYRRGAVKLWSVDTGKVIKTWRGHTDQVTSLGWSPDGGRVVSGSWDKTFRVWDVDSGRSILGPITTGDHASFDVQAVCYSPDAKMIATAGSIRGGLKIWDANSGKLLQTFKGVSRGLAWTSDGKTLIAGRSKFDTATWTKVDLGTNFVTSISLSPNDRILVTTRYKDDMTVLVQLWDLETNRRIGTPLRHPDHVYSSTFSVDGKFLLTCCDDDHIYTWDVSAIVREAGLPSHIVDVTPRPPKIKGARVPPGFFDDALREANLRIRLSQSHAPPTPTPHQRTFNPFTSVSRSSEPHGATESATISRSQPFSWTRKISSILRRRDRSDIQLREVEVPYTAGQPRNYHAGKGKNLVASSSRPSNSHTTQQHSAVNQSTPSSPPAANISTIASTPGTMGAPARPPSPVAVWRTHFVRWLCCAPIYHTDGQH